MITTYAHVRTMQPVLKAIGCGGDVVEVQLPGGGGKHQPAAIAEDGAVGDPEGRLLSTQRLMEGLGPCTDRHASLQLERWAPGGNGATLMVAGR